MIRVTPENMLLCIVNKNLEMYRNIKWSSNGFEFSVEHIDDSMLDRIRKYDWVESVNLDSNKLYIKPLFGYFDTINTMYNYNCELKDINNIAELCTNWFDEEITPYMLKKEPDLVELVLKGLEDIYNNLIQIQKS